MPSVSASVFRGDELLWQESLGLADVEASAEATPETQYRIGSITKTFTAVGVLQLRDAGELSLDDPLTRFLPESAHGPTIGRMLAHSSGLQREPPGEIWETMQAPNREELLSGTADAEQVLEPGSWWHYSNLAFALLGEVVARAHGGTWEEALQARVLDPLGLGRTTPAATAPAARGYFVEPYSDAVRREPDPDLGGAGALGKLWSTTGDLARWGAFLAAGDDRVLKASTLEEMAHVRAMVDHEGWKLGVGDRARALPPRRPRLRRPRRRHAGASRGPRRQPQDEDRRRGADEHGCRRLAGEARDRSRRRGDRGAAARGGRLAAGRAGAAGDRAAARPLVGRRLRDGVLVAKGPPRSEARRRPTRAGHVVLRARGRRSLPLRRRARARASCSASSATPTARSRSSTSRRIRCAASRRPSSGRRRRRSRTRCPRRRRS